MLLNSSQNPAMERSDLDRLLTLKDTAKALQSRPERLAEEAESLEEATLISQVENGVITPPGVELTVQVMERRFPAWKEEFISRLGKTEADLVLESTPSKIYKRLVVR